MLRTFYQLFLLLTVSFSLTANLYCQTNSNDEQKNYQKWEFLYKEKCSKCHTLERVFAKPKTENEWHLCVIKMMRKSPIWISNEEADIIINEIIQTKPAQITTIKYKKIQQQFKNVVY